MMKEKDILKMKATMVTTLKNETTENLKLVTKAMIRTLNVVLEIPMDDGTEGN